MREPGRATTMPPIATPGDIERWLVEEIGPPDHPNRAHWRNMPEPPPGYVGYADPAGNPISGEAIFYYFHFRERWHVGWDDFGEGWAVSTVYLVLNHGFGQGPPLIYETMSFGFEGESLAQHRYATWAEAVAGHAAVADELRAMLGQ